jgi:TolA-binding protein
MFKCARIAVFTLGLFLSLSVFSRSHAADTAAAAPCCGDIEEAKSGYFKDNRYDEFVDFLSTLKGSKEIAPGCLDYYKALSRYEQLKYLEKNQLWDDYFSNGNAYRDDILECAQKAIAETDAGSCLRVKDRLLLWQFYYDQQATFGEQGLDELEADVSAYAKTSADSVLIKETADKLLEYGEKSGARAIYKIYVNRLASGNISDAQLKSDAQAFYQDGNLDLSEEVYDIYIDRISKTLAPEALIPELFGIAGNFVYKPSGLYDMAYAEKIYSKIDLLGQNDSFDQDTIYLRAFNLEKMKEYKAAADFYSRLVTFYPDTKYFDEAVYKIAMINAYALDDLAKAREYFNKLVSKSESSPQAISGFYQLGLLAQWEGDYAKARGYYESLVKGAGEGYAQRVAQAKDRLKEIEENKPIDYNLKTFLDVVLKKDGTPVEMGSSELKLSSFVADKGQKIDVSAWANMPESGCNQIQVQYLWSGSLGGAEPQVSDSGFQCSYADPGTQEINMVVVSPGGISDCSFAMVDVR